MLIDHLAAHLPVGRCRLVSRPTHGTIWHACTPQVPIPYDYDYLFSDTGDNVLMGSSGIASVSAQSACGQRGTI